MFLRSPDVQQRVLQMESAKERLEYIIATLEDATKRLVAQRALASVFSTKATTEDADAPEDGGAGGSALLPATDASRPEDSGAEAQGAGASASGASAARAQESGGNGEAERGGPAEEGSGAAGASESEGESGDVKETEEGPVRRDQKVEPPDASAESDSASRSSPEKGPD
jgi:hypothetical protein